jgi:hypothetical protein
MSEAIRIRLNAMREEVNRLDAEARATHDIDLIHRNAERVLELHAELHLLTERQRRGVSHEC